MSYECSNAGAPTAPAKRKQVVAGGGCGCDDVSVTITTGQPAASGYAIVRVYNWEHNDACRQRATTTKLRSPEAFATLEQVLRQNLGKTNLEIIALYLLQIAQPIMAARNMTFQEVRDEWSANPASVPRDVAISQKVRIRLSANVCS